MSWQNVNIQEVILFKVKEFIITPYNLEYQLTNEIKHS